MALNVLHVGKTYEVEFSLIEYSSNNNGQGYQN